MNKYQRNDKVFVNGSEAIVLDQYSEGMYNVRLFSGTRHVGDACVPTEDIIPREVKTTPAELAFLFSRNEWEQIKTEAENAWLEGKDANANPYPVNSNKHLIWHRAWHQCNLYA